MEIYQAAECDPCEHQNGICVMDTDGSAACVIAKKLDELSESGTVLLPILLTSLFWLSIFGGCYCARHVDVIGAARVVGNWIFSKVRVFALWIGATTTWIAAKLIRGGAYVRVGVIHLLTYVQSKYQKNPTDGAPPTAPTAPELDVELGNSSNGSDGSIDFETNDSKEKEFDEKHMEEQLEPIAV
ncbi:hypothetical protein B9Z55_021840 [Caenorhabditis nigoni]|uniref:Transmembrane protein n=1 Tax=Caenorhabditis nigoni TaxID=1611254 RepID=A0A2G5TUN9_9PELO|nr:hypothetical protein B9Z55_021840 [Caenorhabditis nigoni]